MASCSGDENTVTGGKKNNKMEPQDAVALGSDGGGGGRRPCDTAIQVQEFCSHALQCTKKECCSLPAFQGPLLFPFTRRQMTKKHLYSDDVQSRPNRDSSWQGLRF